MQPVVNQLVNRLFNKEDLEIMLYDNKYVNENRIHGNCSINIFDHFNPPGQEASGSVTIGLK